MGNRLGNAPNLELDSGMTYHWNVTSSLIASAGFDLNWRGGTFYYVQGDPRQFEPAYVLIDPRLTLSDEADVWKVSLWAKNVTNKHYFAEIFNDGGSVVGFPAAPRQVGVTFSHHWRDVDASGRFVAFYGTAGHLTLAAGPYVGAVLIAGGGHGPLLWFGVITVALCYASFLTAVALGSTRTAARGAHVRL